MGKMDAGMDKVAKKFDEWAKSGKAESMESEHKKSVSKFLDAVKFDEPFSFLDVGCGNGWVVRKISENTCCKKAIGIDKSKGMIARAASISGKKERYIHADVESWRYSGKFDYVFSMESIYYADSVSAALAKIFRLLKPGGTFFCGTDFYSDNKATARWADIMKIQMHLYSKREWRRLFKNAGFNTKVKQIKDPKSKKKWRREYGTLFITGIKP